MHASDTITQALLDLRRDPQRRGVRPSYGDLWAYHIRSSSRRLEPFARVRNPRHIVVFRFDDERLEVVRILHDSMDLERRLKRP